MGPRDLQEYSGRAAAAQAENVAQMQAEAFQNPYVWPAMRIPRRQIFMLAAGTARSSVQTMIINLFKRAGTSVADGRFGEWANFRTTNLQRDHGKIKMAIVCQRMARNFPENSGMGTTQKATQQVDKALKQELQNTKGVHFAMDVQYSRFFSLPKKKLWKTGGVVIDGKTFLLTANIRN